MSHGQFVWYELMTQDAEAAAKFYAAVVGWRTKDSGIPGISYTLFLADEQPVAGLMALPAEATARGARPSWIGDIAVPDIAASVQALRALGGSVHREPTDIPSVGKYAPVADPDGAGFVLFQPQGDGETPQDPRKVGHFAWHELFAVDGVKAFDFYSRLFGWTKTETTDLGPMGIYQMFGTKTQHSVGGMMTMPDGVPAPYWQYYITVDAIEDAAKRVADAGGRIVNGPMQVPGGEWIAHGVDPQGASFAICSNTQKN